MIVKYIIGNLVQLAVTSKQYNLGVTVAHGCNCFNVMGAGIAAQFANAIPEVLIADNKAHASLVEHELHQRRLLGLIDSVDVGGCTIVNMYTQYKPGPNCDYDAIKDAFTKVNELKINQLYIPRIGAGIACGEWEIIEEIINEATPNLKIIVVDWDGTIV